MPTDARILLSGDRAVTPPLAHTMGQIAEVRTQQAQAEEQALLRRTLQESPDEPTAISRLRKLGYIDLANKYETNLLDRKKKGYDNAKTALDNDKARLTMGSQLFRAVLENPNPTTYGHARNLFATLAADDPDGQEMLKGLPEQWDDTATPQQLKVLVDGALTAKEASDAKQQALENLFGKEPMTGAASLLSNASSQQEWDQGLKLADEAGIGNAVRSQFGPTFSPESAQRAAQTTISAKDKAGIESAKADDARADQTAAETRRHNLATEANAAATQRRLAAGGGGSAGGASYAALPLADRKRVDSILKNPQLYDRLTPTLQSNLMVALDEKGFQFPSGNKTGGARPITSGDAGRLTELTTSLDDVKVLRETLTGPGSTGAQSQLGAMLPNFVTEYTGIGEGAKQRQAQIDRVKQVIGKALEGGVLRAEDEKKYVKILPTISDPPEVVKTKLKGLEDAIRLRRDRLIESLADAGYDTARFEARTGDRQDTTPPRPAGVPESAVWVVDASRPGGGWWKPK